MKNVHQISWMKEKNIIFSILIVFLLMVITFQKADKDQKV
nr:MAG TPA: hypothetical protein [Caudoviricetes sp.]